MMDSYESEDAFGGDGINTAIRDMLIVSIVAFAALMLTLLAAVSDPKKQVENPSLAAVSPGNVIFEAYWNVTDPKVTNTATGQQDLIWTDVDLWVQYRGRLAEDLEKPVGYSNGHSKTLDHNRDDLGCIYQTASTMMSGCIPFADPANYEVTTSRGFPAGTYCVSVHLYGNRSSLKVIPVKMRIRLQKNPAGVESIVEKPKEILSTEVKLEWVGQEVPVQCFTLNEQGEVVSQSHSDAECLRLQYNHMLNRCSS